MSQSDELFNAIPEHYTVEHILKEFDFYKVERYMRENNWTWISSRGMSTPTIRELRDKAENLLKDARASTRDNMYIGTGGFTVMKSYGCLYLFFVIEESSDEYDENIYYD